MILPAQSIRVAAPIAEMVERCKSVGMTYGLGPAGYDVRIDCRDALIEPGHFLLAATVERFQMPNDLMVSLLRTAQNLPDPVGRLTQVKGTVRPKAVLEASTVWSNAPL